MNCPACSANMPDADVFCEECGATLSGGPPAAPPCPKCGAGPGSIDPEGFCSECGFRRAPRERDHVEIALSDSFAGVTDRGRRHHVNEDYCVLRPGLMVVCDGVSSSQDAQFASKAAGDAAANALAAGRSMADAIAAALAAVNELPRPAAELDAPSTTIVATVFTDQRAIIGWAGDSRAYWFDGAGGSRQLTVDDSWMNDVVARGDMTAAQAEASGNAHAITKWLGADAGDLVPSVVEFEYPGAGMLLLCSDGLWNYAPAVADIAGLLDPPAKALDLARRLVDFANGRGGKDNITAAMYIKS